MKFIAIDYGRRRIGLATTDVDGLSIRGLPTIEPTRKTDTLTQLITQINQENPDCLVVGIPLGPCNEETQMSIEIREFVGRVVALLPKSIPVHYIDESFTSHQAKEILLHRKKSHRRKKGNYDRIAACLILQTFLEERNRS